MRDIIFFSRGRGHGHAVTDVEIVESIREVDAGFGCTMASYGTGWQTFSALGVEALDLNLSDENLFVPTLVAACSLIRELRPSIIIAHEEFAAVAAAAACGVPCIFLSSWFPPVNSLLAETLHYPRALVLLEDGGLFPVPPGLAERVRVAGPVVRRMGYSRERRGEVRAELGIVDDAECWCIISGGWANEERAPVGHLMLDAFACLPRVDKRMIWLGQISGRLAERVSRMPGVEVLPFAKHIDKIMVASDVILTKGTHAATLEAASLGIPSVSLSLRQNPVDEILVPRVRTNTHLHALATSPDMLVQKIADAKGRVCEPLNHHRRGGRVAASIILDEIRRELMV